MKKLMLVVMCMLLPAFAQAQCCGWWGHRGGWEIVMLAFWGAVIAFIVYLVIAASVRNRNRYKNAQSGEALAVLKMRYAKGEISKEDYERIKKDLES